MWVKSCIKHSRIHHVYRCKNTIRKRMVYDMVLPTSIWDYLGVLLENSWKLLNDLQSLEINVFSILREFHVLDENSLPRDPGAAMTVQVPLLLCESWFLLDKSCGVVTRWPNEPREFPSLLGDHTRLRYCRLQIVIEVATYNDWPIDGFFIKSPPFSSETWQLSVAISRCFTGLSQLTEPRHEKTAAWESQWMLDFCFSFGWHAENQPIST